MSASTGRSRGLVRRLASDVSARVPWAVDAYRFARNPRWAADLRRDLRSTRANTGFLEELGPPTPDAPTALIALYRDNIYEAKLGLVLGTALRIHGVRPVVSMPSNRAHRLRRYAGAFGVDTVIAQDLMPLSADERRDCRDVKTELLASASRFEAIKAWEFRGRNIGNHVLSTLIRITFDGSPDLALDRHRELVAAVLEDVLVNSIRAEHLMARVAPEVVLVEEANYSVNGPLVDVAVEQGIDAIQTVGIWRDDSLMSKRLTKATRRVDAQSVAPETLAALEQQPWTSDDDRAVDADFDERYSGMWTLAQQFQPDTERRTGAQIIDELGLDPGRPTAVIFAHVLWDASLFFGVDLFENYADWLVQAVGAATRNDAVNWIVKAHPSNVFRSAHGDVGGESSEVVLVREHYPDLPGHVHLLLPDTRISTLSLYEFADYGVTVRGTPGLEIACFGKPAFTAGTGTYAGLGFTYDSSSQGEFLERMASIHEYGRPSDDMTVRARRYAHAQFVRRPWTTESFALRFQFADQGWHPTDRNVEFTARSVGEIRRLGDLDRFATWALDSDATDLLGRP